MTDEPGPVPEHRWQARPVLARGLHAALLAVPMVASSGAVLVGSRLLPPGAGSAWWGLTTLLVAAVAVAVGVERGARRLMPIALLLKLSMIFPDRAPSRLRLARAAAVRSPQDELLWEGTDARPTSTSELVLNLVAALGAHDRRTRGHSERVRLLCDMLGEQLKLDSDDRDRLRWSALLHDVGKMKVSTSVLNKPGRLDAREFERIKQHPQAGAELAAPLLPWLGEWGDGIVDHHEKYDGSGYPAGKVGQEISTAGRLIGLIDAFETMTAARAYKKAMATKAAREELARCAGTHFDPVMVRAFLAISLPRVLWAMGPLSFLFQLPFLRPLADAGVRTGAAAPQAAAAALASSAAGAAVLVSGGLGTGAAATGMAEMLEDRAMASSSGSGALSVEERLRPYVAPEAVPAPPQAASPQRDEQAAAGQAEKPARADSGKAAATGRPPAPVEVTPAEAQPVEPEPVDPEPVDPEPEDPPEPEPAGAPEDEPADEPGQPEADEQPAEEPALDEPAPAEATPAEPAPAPGGTAPAPPAEPAPVEPAPVEPEPEPTTVIGTGPAIASGPASPTTSREATFELRTIEGVQWQCQILAAANGDNSAYADCPSGTFSVMLVKDGEMTLNVRAKGISAVTDTWTWTVRSRTVSARAATGLTLLDELSPETLPATDSVAAVIRPSPHPALPLMGLLGALGLPFAAATHRLRARRG